jgi:hypothetical protein
MRRSGGPINPVSPHPNGFPAYSMNPVEDLPVAEDFLSQTNFADAYYTEPVFSSQAVYGFEHKQQNYDSAKPRD